MPTIAYEDRLCLKTYRLGPDDPFPPWQRRGYELIYPYPMQDDLQDETSVVAYRALHLENEFLHAIVLPDLGGRLYSLYDKKGRREIFYRNNVVKYGLVARRGAWISGGIEFNFPQGHSCVTVAPVCAEIGKTEAGPEIIVGCLDRTTRMRWRVALSLQGARLVQRVTLENPTPIRQRHYFWANSAVPARDDLQLVFPAYQARLSGLPRPYPIWEGRDVSLYRNHWHADDIFALEVQDDFFGCYYTAADYGMMHWSDHRLNEGKKFFTWGTADDGMIWETLLTDEDGQYVELQSGRFVDQGTFEFLFPFQSVSWVEHWGPVRGLGGWNWANEECVLHIQIGEGRAEIGIFPATAHGPASVVLTRADGRRVTQPCVLQPGEPSRVLFALPTLTPAELLTISVLWRGRELVRYAHPPAYEKRRQEFAAAYQAQPSTPMKKEDSPAPTAEALCLQAVAQEKRAGFEEAERLYRQALAREPLFARAHGGLGLLLLRKGLWEEAQTHLRQAVERDPEYDEAAYYLALTEMQREAYEEAERWLWRLRERSACAREAAVLLAALYRRWRSRTFPESVEDEEAFVSSAAPRDKALWLAEHITNEAEAQEAWERVFSVPFIGWLAEDAVTQLQPMAASSYGQRDPLVYYYLAHLAPPQARAYRRRLCQKADPTSCFPARLEDLVVLAQAAARDSQDWLARLLQGELLAFLGRFEEALTAWQEAAQIVEEGRAPAIIRPALVPQTLARLHRNIGLGLSLWRQQPRQALRHYTEALRLWPDQYRLYLEQDGVMQRAGLSPRRRLHALERAPAAVAEKWQIAARKIELLVALRRWRAALTLLQAFRFKPWEGARGMHALWVAANVGLAEQYAAQGKARQALRFYEQALEYPRSLGVGRQAYPNEAKWHWLAAEAAGQAGDTAKRVAHLQAAAGEPQRQITEATIYKAMALRALGRGKEARALQRELERWAAQRRRERPEDPLLREIEEFLEKIFRNKEESRKGRRI